MRKNLLAEIDWLYAALNQYGIDPEVVTQYLPKGNSADLPHLVTFDHYLSLLNSLAELTGDPLFGMHVTEALPMEMLGIYGYLVTNAPTLRDLCQNAARYWATLTQASTVEFSEQKRSSALQYRFLVSTDIPAHQEVESTLTGLVVLFRQRIGAKWTPQEAHFQHLPQGPIDSYQRIFGNNVQFEMPSDQILFDSQVLDLSYARADAHLMGILREQAERLLQSVARSDDLVGNVRLLIMSQLAIGKADVIGVAKQLHMSPRKLQQKLRQHHTSFSEIKDDLREELAKRALLESDSSVATIAQKLGFAESASFNHSFRRRMGVSPLQYRKSHDGPSA